MICESRRQSIRNAVLADAGLGNDGNDRYLLELARFSRCSKLPMPDIKDFADKIRRLCKEESGAVSQDNSSHDSSSVDLKLEIKALKKKMNECNLSAMKHIAALKALPSNADAFTVNAIAFYEPLTYLDADTKELLMFIMNDKLRQARDNTIPQSLVDAVVASTGDSSSSVWLGTWKQRLEEQLAARTEELHNEHVKLIKAEQDLESMRQAHQFAYAQITSIAMEAEDQESFIAEFERLQSAAKRTQSLEQKLCSLQGLYGSLDLSYADLQGRFDELKESSDIMRKDLARRNDVCVRDVQTLLTHSQIEESDIETKRMKVMLEELQEKLKELVKMCHSRGMGKEVMEFAKIVGLQPVIEGRTVFQRLYDDAMDRIARLERMREKARLERDHSRGFTGYFAPPPSSLPALTPREQVVECSVLEQVGRSELRGLQDLVPRKFVASSSSLDVHSDVGECEHASPPSTSLSPPGTGRLRHRQDGATLPGVVGAPLALPPLSNDLSGRRKGPCILVGS
eukprot:TRINITY_DN67038_c0_g1_i1.p1 TRINITY_DN67038_c0_g1~~TRINITY_DN67038_c0_g1_i1.p1  ORF type:complete len:549 (-),score=52.74 TRINITY_DN67038_c0_g1_i1:220-1758(-)